MAVIKRHKSTIAGLPTDLSNLAQAIAQEATDRGSAISTAIVQEASDRTSAIAAAIATEVNDRNAAIASVVGNAAGDYLAKAANLSDLVSAGDARVNLDVYSVEEVDQAIADAKLALGTNYTVADNAERDLLTGLDAGDTVTVLNGGAWVKYGVQSVTAGVATFYVMGSKEQWEASNSAAAVLAALLSNADTNVLTDAEKAKLDGFDPVQYALKTDLTASENTQQAYTDQAIAAASQLNVTEVLSVTGDTIVLTKKPKDGMIYNFATVRNVTDGLTYDIPVVVDGSDVSGKTYTLQPDTTGEFDGKSVVIQYPAVQSV